MLKELRKDFGKDIVVLDKENPDFIKNLYSDDLKIGRGAYTSLSLRWARLFLFINEVLKRPEKTFLLDRGILTNYVQGVEAGVPEEILDELINEFLMLVDGINYYTVFLDCSIKTAEKRLKDRQFKGNIQSQQEQVNYKRARNLMFKKYLESIKEYKFLGQIKTINTDGEDAFVNYENLKKFIKDNLIK